MSSLSLSEISCVNARVDTLSSTESGIVFGESPPWTAPTVTTPISCGSMLREMMVCKLMITFAASTTGSMPRCGIEPCEPRPKIVILVCTHVENTGPDSAPTP